MVQCRSTLWIFIYYMLLGYWTSFANGTEAQAIELALKNIFASSIIIQPGVDTEVECYQPLRNSVGNDEFLSRNEYVDFVNFVSDDEFSSVTNFLDLPPLLISNYNNLICIYCDSIRNEGSQCCTDNTAQLNVTGVKSGNLAGTQKTFVLEICTQVINTIDTITGPSQPSASPSKVPSRAPTALTNAPTEVPTNAPTEVPSIYPSVSPSSAPSVSPSKHPSTHPSLTHSSAPSKTPSKLPSIAPSNIPSFRPSKNPSGTTPTVSPSNKPTTPPVPSTTPSISPSTEPSFSPSISPTVEPSTTPSLRPSAQPSLSPSAKPSTTPSLRPSAHPSLPPSNRPSQIPSVGPTNLPSFHPSNMPSRVPSIAPSNSPTVPNVANTSFPVSFILTSEEGVDMDVLMSPEYNETRAKITNAVNVLFTEIQTTAGRASRRLYFEVNDDAPLGSITNVDCPSSTGTSNTQKCTDISHSVSLVVTNEPISAAESRFISSFDSLVAAGRLNLEFQKRGMPFGSQAATPTPTPSPVIPGGRQPTITASASSSNNTGLIAGMAVSASFLVVASAAFLLVRRRSREDKEETIEVEQFASTPNQYPQKPILGPPGARQVMHDNEVPGTSMTSLTPVVEVKEFDYSDDDSSRHKYIPDVEESLESSSNAGSSGWSSSAGISSLNTASVDSMDFTYGASLAAIGATSSLHNRYEQEKQSKIKPFVPVTKTTEREDTDEDQSSIGSESAASGSMENTASTQSRVSQVDSVPELPVVSRADLDSAIEAGDWAAVGATAALLAQSSESLSYKSSSDVSTSASGLSGLTKSSTSSLDAAQTRELDQLVDAGDWDGVVLAAAKFEASTDSEDVTSGSRSWSEDPLSTAVSSRSRTDTSLGESYVSTSESASQARKIEEIRQEVAALVRRVVPEEVDNIDEMMLQFRGREEELVETLRKMQERSIAQRAREAAHRSAKREARLSAKDARDGRDFGASAGGQYTSSSQSDSTSTDYIVGANTALGTAAVAHAMLAAHRTNNTSSSEGYSSSTTREFTSSTTNSVSVTTSGTSTDQSSAILYPATSMLSTTTSVTTDGLDHTTVGESTDFTTIGTTTTSTQTHDDDSPQRTAMEMAIEAGDWAAVGQAAAMLSSDQSVSTTSSNASSMASSKKSKNSTLSGSISSSGLNSKRAEELDRLIDRADWTGVVAAASRYNVSDRSLKAKGTRDSSSASLEATAQVPSISESSSLEPDTAKQSWKERIMGKRSISSQGEKSTTSFDNRSKSSALQEEEEALAQAEIWMKIAAQSKIETSGATKGASDAADWAIARSLSALRVAEEKGQLARDKQSECSTISVGSSGDKSV